MSPAKKQQIEDLTQPLESIQAVEPQLPSIVNDHIIQGDSCLAGGRYSEAIDSYDRAMGDRLRKLG